MVASSSKRPSQISYRTPYFILRVSVALVSVRIRGGLPISFATRTSGPAVSSVIKESMAPLLHF